MVNVLDVDNINVFYGKIQVLWDISLHVSEKEIVGLLGPNGAGKSTLLKTILGVNPIHTGSIKYLGQDISKSPTHEIVDQGIIYIPEGRRIFPEMTALENLELGAITKRSEPKKEESLKWVFKLFPRLDERKNQIAGTMSGGERQMLALGRGLMGVPRFLMIDEPSLGLAPKVLARIFEAIKEVNVNGVTILLVEQNAKQTLEICQRACVIENGRIVIEGDRNSLVQNDRIRKAYLGL